MRQEGAFASSTNTSRKNAIVLLAHHLITVEHALPPLLIAAGVALLVFDVRARERSDRQAELQHAAYELGRRVALDRTPVSA